MSDWRDETAYEKLKPLDRSGFAWEYLRRNPQYREDRRKRTTVARLSEGVIATDGTSLPLLSWGLRFRGRPRPAGLGSTPFLG